MTEVKGLLVFYVDVGNLPPNVAKEFVKKIEQQLQHGSDDLPEERKWIVPKDVGMFFVPVRDKKSKIEYISFKRITSDVKKQVDNLKNKFSEFYMCCGQQTSTPTDA